MKNSQNHLFGNLHHICIVVKDIEKAIRYYESLGMGPWGHYPSLEIYKNELSVPDVEGFLNMKYRFCNLANVQIQLCDPGSGDSPQQKFLDTKGEGVFHLGFTSPDIDAAEVQAQEVGLAPWMRGRMSPGSGFTYFNTSEAGAGVTLEIRANKLV